MLELFRTADGSLGLAAEETLVDLVLAHRVVVIGPGEPAPSLPDGTPLPALRDGDEIHAGAEAVAAHLGEIRRFAADWSRFQSDTCYVGAR